MPDYEHLLDVVEDIDAIEVFNPRVAFSAFNEEAARFAAKYRIVAGAGSDSHVAQGLGSVKIRMRDFDGPEEFLESLRDADIVRKQQRCCTCRRSSSSRRRGPKGAQRGKSDAAQKERDGRAVKTLRQVPATDDEIREKYLERAIRELNQLTREIQELRPLPARQPDARARLGPPAGRHLPPQVRAAARRRSRRAWPSTGAPAAR